MKPSDLRPKIEIYQQVANSSIHKFFHYLIGRKLLPQRYILSIQAKGRASWKKTISSRGEMIKSLLDYELEKKITK